MKSEESLAQRIRRLRLEAFGETYREADKATGISASSWANWETKGTRPYGSSLLNLAAEFSKALGRTVTTDEILTGRRADHEHDRAAVASEVDRGIAASRRRPRGTPRPNGERQQGR